MGDSGTSAAAKSPSSPKSPKSPKSPAAGTETGQPQPDLQLETPGILPASQWEPLPRHELDNDSTYSDLQSSTASITSSILHYRNIHGRTFHSDVGRAESWQPNDAQHVEAMDIAHHLVHLMLGEKPFLTPINHDAENLKVLDVGTGTGIWAIDFADEHPNAEVIGTDLSPIQPSWLPSNVRFEIDDANLNWTWSDNTFDFIHVRFLVGAIENWGKLFKEAYRCCKPGGWVESHEPSLRWQTAVGEIHDDSPMGQWTKVYHEAGKKLGRTFRLVDDDQQQKLMAEAGFVDIVVKDIKVPMGNWPEDPKQKELGMISQLAALSDLEGYILYIWNAVMGWSRPEVLVYTAYLRRQIKDPNLKPWFLRRVVYGRKPETAA